MESKAKENKKIMWIFNQEEGAIEVSKDSVKAEIESQFKFKLTRYKNSENHQESLRVDCIYNNNPNGYIYTDLIDLDNDLAQFMKYGVAFSNMIYGEIYQKIKDNYLKLKIFKTNEESIFKIVNDTIMKEILEMISEDVKEHDEKDGYYNIPVNEFNGLIEDSMFKDYDIIDIKRWLADKGYIKCGKGRLSNTVRLKEKDKPIRVISFKADKMKEYMEQADESNSIKEG